MFVFVRYVCILGPLLVVSWLMPDLFTAQLDVAASVTEQMAEATEDAESRRLLVDNASTMRHGSKVARRFKQSTAAEFEQGVRPSFGQTSELATRYNIGDGISRRE